MNLVKLMVFSIFSFGMSSVLFAKTEISKDQTQDIYFVAGNPTGTDGVNYSTVLLKLNGDNSLVVVRSITTQTQGSEFIRPYYDDQKVIVGSLVHANRLQLDIINMQAVKEERSVELQLCDTCYFTHGYQFSDQFTSGFFASNVKKKRTTELILTKVDYTTRQQAFADHNLIQKVQAFGGSTGNFQSDSLRYLYTYNQRPVFSSALKLPLNWAWPINLQLEDGERFELLVNNNLVRVITPHRNIVKNKNKGTNYKHWIFDKVKNKWTNITLINSGWAKGFGHWLTTEEQFAGFTAHKALKAYRQAQTIQQRSASKHVHYLERHNNWDINKTGVLLIVNLLTQDVTKINTGHPDSEVLLISANQIVYRVNDTLFTANIVGKDVKKTELLFRGRKVPAIHWAFIGKQ